ncbi:hypothetical protein [Flagellimonas pacifica]|uniref:Fibronectin type-III domain-containing protein n=1 Tax=Flagellimonas pacifica TaxID=1247520 RepID=A0A285MRW7_9FLAO|nr:hypothetical protein [Allomuricauda parva]SNY99932.1 hypothetical protein SAMN06265377_1747 [Allomuricauda parva]
MDSVNLKRGFELFLIASTLLLSCSDSGNEEPVSAKNQAPSSFTINISGVQQKSADLNWTKSTDPEGSTVFYDLFLDGEKLVDNTRELSYSFSNLNEASEYKGKVVASDPEGNEVSQEFGFTTLENGTPSAFNVQVDPGNHTYSRAKWTESKDPESSEVVYKVALNGSILVEDHRNLEFLLPELKGLTNYTLVVTASDEDGNSSSAELSWTTLTKVFENDIRFENQMELDEFGEKGYNRIEGDIYIGSNLNLTDINDLTPLSSISYIRGNLSVYRTRCQNLNGLENISDHWIFTEIKIVDNQELLNIDGLSGFVRPYYIYINYNSKLQNIDGLSNVTGTQKECTISANDGLVDIKGLRNLKYTPEVEISNNDKISDLSGLENLVSVTQGVYIFQNEQLVSAKGLDNLKIGGSVNFDRNPNLTSISDLTSLESVRSFEITGSPLLESLTGLENLREVTDALRLSGNKGLKSLEGIEKVEFKNNSRNYYHLAITDSPLITNLDPLINYSIPSGNINIRENTSLTDLCGITQLAIDFNDEIGDNFSIRDNLYNPSLQDIVDGNCSQ